MNSNSTDDETELTGIVFLKRSVYNDMDILGSVKSKCIDDRKWTVTDYMKKETYKEKIDEALQLIRVKHGMVRTREFANAGITYKQLLYMVEKGILVRAKSGYYTAANETYRDEEILCTLYKDGVLTMESALYLHGYINGKPDEWQLAISKNTSKSRFINPPIPIEPFYTEERVLPIGAEEMVIFEEAEVAETGVSGEMEENKAAGTDRLIEKEESGEMEENKAAGAGESGEMEENGAAGAKPFREKHGLSGKLSIRVYGIDRLICDVLKYEEKLSRDNFKAAVRAYINDDRKDVAKLLLYAKERKVLKKVQGIIGVWL